MPVSSYVTSFNTGTAAPGNTVVVTGVGFLPKAAILMWSGDTSTTDTAGRATQYRGMGAIASPTQRWCTGSIIADAVATMDNAMWHINDACVVMPSNTADTSTGRLDLQSFDSDGATFIIDETFAASIRVHVWFLGGSDITNVETGVFQEPGATGTQEINLSGAFRPTVVFLGHASFNAGANDWSFDAIQMVGAFTATDQWVVAVGSNDGGSTSQTIRYSVTSECVALPSSTVVSINGRAAFSSMDSDGFTVNWVERASTRWVHFLAIKGGRWKVGSVQTRTDGNDIAVTGLGSTCVGAFVASHCTAFNSVDVIVDHDVLSLGAASSVSRRGAVGMYNVDNVGPSESSSGIEHDAVYLRLTSAGAIDGLMDVNSFDSDGVTFVMDDADPAAAGACYAIVGSAIVMAADAGSFTLTGQSVTSRISMVASVGSFTLTGQNAATNHTDNSEGGLHMGVARRRRR